jgi:Acyl-CoA dehydrogenase, N-terminal domain
VRTVSRRALWETDLNRRYPQEFVDTLTGAGLLAALSMITEAWVRLNPRPLLRHGSDEQKDTYLPQIAKGELRLQPSPSPNPPPGRTSPASSPPPSATAITTSSPGTGTGPAGSPSPTWPWCLPAPVTRPRTVSRHRNTAGRFCAAPAPCTIVGAGGGHTQLTKRTQCSDSVVRLNRRQRWCSTRATLAG